MYKAILFCLLLAFTLAGCRKPDPAKYVTTAFINANLLFGFASDGLNQELAQPAQMLEDADKQTFRNLKRTEVLEYKITNASDALKKIEALPDDADARPMVQASVQLFQLVLAGYRNEYTQLAKLYDAGAATESIQAMEKQIQARYAAEYQRLAAALEKEGMHYAQEHQVPVQSVNSTPPQ
jgi:hypothetical protein